MRKVKSTIIWASIEPYSWDSSESFRNSGLDWVVIGGASDGPRKHQPDHSSLERLLKVLDEQDIPVYMKSNLHYEPRRTEFLVDMPQ